jgi:hypothetical protein
MTTINTGNPITGPLPFIEEYGVGTLDVMGQFGSDAIRLSPLSSLIRAREQRDAQEGPSPSRSQFAITDPEVRESLGLPPPDPLSPELSTEDQQALIEEAGVKMKPVKGLREKTLRLRIAEKVKERQSVFVTSSASGGQMALGFVAGVVASVFDPINLASAFIPVIGPARYTKMLANQASAIGRAKVRSKVGAAEGAFGAVLVEPIVFSQAQQEQLDYKMADSLLNVAFGTVMGGGLHVGGGLLFDRIKGPPQLPTTPLQRQLAALDPEARELFFKMNVAQVVHDRIPSADPRAVAPRVINPPHTAVGRVLDAARADTKVEFETVGTVDLQLRDGGSRTIPIKVREEIKRRGIPAEEVNEIIAAQTPEQHARIDTLRKRIAKITGEEPEHRLITQDLEETVARGLAVLEKLKGLKDRRSIRRQEAKLAEIETSLGELGFKPDVREAAKQLRQRQRSEVKRTDETKALEKEEAALKDDIERVTRQTLKDMTLSQPYSVYKVTQVDTIKEQVEQATRPENLMLFDKAALDRRESAMVDAKDHATIEGAEESLQLEMDRMSEVLGSLDESDAVIKEVLDSLIPDIAESEAFARGVKSYAMCRLSGGV